MSQNGHFELYFKHLLHHIWRLKTQWCWRVSKSVWLGFPEPIISCQSVHVYWNVPEVLASLFVLVSDSSFFHCSRNERSCASSPQWMASSSFGFSFTRLHHFRWRWKRFFCLVWLSCQSKSHFLLQFQWTRKYLPNYLKANL